MFNYSNKQTNLDLNGPIISFVQNPESTSVCYSGFATFIGIATVSFPNQVPNNFPSNTGILTYRWYDQNGPLFDDPPEDGGDGLSIVGSGSTTLTLYNNIESKTLSLRADYIPSAYTQPIGSSSTVGTARSTGNAINEPSDSTSATLTVFPTIFITSEPLDSTVNPGQETTFQVTASSSDNTPLSYQWQLNGIDLIDTISGEQTTIKPSNAIINLTDDTTGITTSINFNEVASYSDFIPGITYTLVSTVDIETTLTASGAGGSSSPVRTRYAPGGKGGLSKGKFTFVAGQQYKLVVGSAGGGLTGLFIDSITQENAIIIAGGGGGGANDVAIGGDGGGLIGGNAQKIPRGGRGGTQLFGGSGGLSIIDDGARPGATGGPLVGGVSGVIGNRFTGGGGRGGDGYFGGGGGQDVNGCCADGAGGGGSGYIHPTLLTESSTVAGKGAISDANGSFVINLVGTSEIVLVSISGSNTPNLTISSSTSGLFTVNCIVTHPTTCDEPLITREANYTVVNSRPILVFENIQSSSEVDFYTWNLSNSEIELGIDIPRSFISFYASERDIDVEMELHGKSGSDYDSNTGGIGGYSVIRFTMKKDDEYILAEYESGGIFIYRKSRLIAAIGEGGNAFSGGDGGLGGGIGIGGGRGGGIGGGLGGQAYPSGSLPLSSGIFGSSFVGEVLNENDTKAEIPFGGRVLPCPRGNQSVSPCSDLGIVQFLWQQSVAVPGTAVINRGFKQGYGIRQTSGLGNNGGNGGRGATGGAGGVSGGGGGGGSGYSDGSIVVAVSELGGSQYSDGRIFIREVL